MNGDKTKILCFILFHPFYRTIDLISNIKAQRPKIEPILPTY